MITKEQVNYMLQERVNNPVPLTQEVLQANGLTPEWAEPDWELWTYQDKFNVSKKLIEEELRYAFNYVYAPGEEIEINYEHQLQGLISLYP